MSKNTIMELEFYRAWVSAVTLTLPKKLLYEETLPQNFTRLKSPLYYSIEETIAWKRGPCVLYGFSFQFLHDYRSILTPHSM